MGHTSRRSRAWKLATGLGLLSPLSACAVDAASAGAVAANDGQPSEVASAAQGLSQVFVTAAKPYVVPMTPEYAIQPLLSVGDRVPRSSNPEQQYQMVGIPDGIGSYKDGDRVVVMFNHELTNTTTSEPIVGQPLNRGSIVSKLVLDRDGYVISGDRAYDTIWNENTLVGPAPDATNSVPGFGRFCSSSLSWRDAGFDRPIYFAGEEASGAQTHDGLGGLTVAILDNELHTLPKFGRFPWENTVAQPKKGDRTVLIGMEDGPPGPESQLYMYVGKKERKKSSSALRRNGLDNGKMYVFVSDTPLMTNEVVFQNGAIEGHWAVIDNPETLTDVQLEAAADAIGAFGFVRTEDGAFDPENPDDYYFVTTGGSAGNELGRLYRMQLDPSDPTGHTTIEVIFNADQIIAAGGDIAVSPDNMDVDGDYVIINEDGTAQSRVVMTARGREASVWRFDIHDEFAATRIAELNPPGRDANFAITSGIWETTGIVSSPGQKASYFMNVQAHAPTLAPLANTVEDGQLVLMRRTKFDAL